MSVGIMGRHWEKYLCVLYVFHTLCVRRSETFAGEQRVFHEGAYRHRSDATRDRGYELAFRRHIVEVYISAEPETAFA